jgi:hypothetical protein
MAGIFVMFVDMPQKHLKHTRILYCPAFDRFIKGAPSGHLPGGVPTRIE